MDNPGMEKSELDHIWQDLKKPATSLTALAEKPPPPIDWLADRTNQMLLSSAILISILLLFTLLLFAALAVAENIKADSIIVVRAALPLQTREIPAGRVPESSSLSTTTSTSTSLAATTTTSTRVTTTTRMRADIQYIPYCNNSNPEHKFGVNCKYQTADCIATGDSCGGSRGMVNCEYRY